MKEMMVILISAILVNNFVLSKFMGVCPFLGVSKKVNSAFGMSVAVIFVMLMATAVTYPIYTLLLAPYGLEYLRIVVFILIIALFVQMVEIGLKRFMPPLYKALGVYLPLITTNCAVLGVTLLNIDNEYTFAQSMVNALGGGLGFMLALILFAGIRQKIDSSELPNAFKGMPATLVAASIVSVSFVGFGGVVEGMFKVVSDGRARLPTSAAGKNFSRKGLQRFMFETYFLPILLFVGLGILAGLLLAVVSTVFAVKSDEKTLAVREALPGVNCGVCGFSGCDQYAGKIVKEGERTNRCVPGGDAAAKKISEIMGVSFEDVTEKVAVVHCGGVCGATSDKYEYHGTPTCAACNEFYAGSGRCDYGCIGFGDCVKACRYDAIHLVDGVARVDPERCVGCTMCAVQCPKHLINIVDATAKVNVICASQNSGKVTRINCTNGCIACKKCEKTCPYDAIHVEGNLARIDYDKCTRCGACVKVCPVQCIHSF